MTRIPIACSLSARDGVARVQEWRAFAHDHIVDTERTSHAARLRLRDGTDAVLAATDLARREKACCPFFEFRLLLLTDAIWLEVDAPNDAKAVLDGLVSLTTA